MKDKIAKNRSLDSSLQGYMCVVTQSTITKLKRITLKPNFGMVCLNTLNFALFWKVEHTTVHFFKEFQSYL